MRSGRLWRCTAVVAAFTSLCSVGTYGTEAVAQNILYQETFNDDGEAAGRYTIVGRGIDPALATGFGYWEHSFNVIDTLGFVGTGNTAAARRAAILWGHDVDPEQWTDQAVAVFEGTVDWALDGKANANIYMIPSASAASDAFVKERLEAKGHTVHDLAADAALPDPSQADLVFQSSAADSNPPTKLNNYAVPVITWNQALHDDIAVSTIGEIATMQPTVTINDPAHPAAGGVTGSFEWTKSPQPLRTIGKTIPATGKVVATYDLVFPPVLNSLEQVDQMIAGTLPSLQTTGTIDVADLADGAPGRWSLEYDIPGQPQDETWDAYAIVGRGTMNVLDSGTYSFALGGDDGGRLRIDLNKNDAFDDGETIILDNTAHAFEERFGDATLQSGLYDFEWIGFDQTGDAGWELSYAPGANVRTTPGIGTDWEALGDHLPGFTTIELNEPINITTYRLDTPPDVEQRPAVVVFEAGDALLGGSITGAEGEGFFVGADLNEPSYGGGANPRTLTLQPIDVTGQEDLQLTLSLAGTVLDFEADDFFRILVDPDNEGPEDFVVLTQFVGNAEKALSNGEISLDTDFQDVTLDIPDGATELVVRFEAMSTFYNEIVAFDNVRIHAGDLVPSLAGDINADSKVDLADFLILKSNFGTGSTAAQGDLDNDGKVNLADFLILKNNFGKKAAAVGSAVPEPSSFALLALAGLALAALARRRRAF